MIQFLDFAIDNQFYYLDYEKNYNPLSRSTFEFVKNNKSSIEGYIIIYRCNHAINYNIRTTSLFYLHNSSIIYVIPIIKNNLSWISVHTDKDRNRDCGPILDSEIPSEIKNYLDRIFKLSVFI